MPLTVEADRRSQLLERLGWAQGTLRSAVSTVNVGEPYEGCAGTVAEARQIGLGRIALMRTYLDELEALLKP